jgi:hypothetical protein
MRTKYALMSKNKRGKENEREKGSTKNTQSKAIVYISVQESSGALKWEALDFGA